jgi:hypothetical protein
MTAAKGSLFAEPFYTPLAPLTNLPMPNATLQFWLSRTSGKQQAPAVVYTDPAMTLAYGSNVITAVNGGQFPAIYLPPNVPVRVQLFDATGRLLQDVDPYIPSGRFTGNAVVPAPYPISNTQTLAPDPALNIALPGAGTYRYELYAEFVLEDTVHNPNINFGMYLVGGGNGSGAFNSEGTYGGLLQDIPLGLVPALGGAGIEAADYFGDPISSATVEGSSGGAPISNFPIVQSTTTHTPLRVTGVVTCTAPCTLAFFWAPNENNTTPVVLVQGSYIKVQSVQPTPGVLPVQTSPSLSASISPSAISATAYSFNYVTSAANASARGGVGSYWYAWSMQGGSSPNISVGLPSASSTTFNFTNMTPGTFTGVAQCAVTDSRGDVAIATVSLSVTCAQDYTGAVTLGTDTTGTLTGFLNGFFGSVSPTADVNGDVINTLAVNFGAGPPPYLQLSLTGTLPQNAIGSVSFPALGLTFLTNNANSFFQGGGVTTWQWNTTTPPWTQGQTGTVAWTLP